MQPLKSILYSLALVPLVFAVSACGEESEADDAGLSPPDSGLAVGPRDSGVSGDAGESGDAGTPAGTVFRAVLSGAEENPSVRTAATGTAMLTLGEDQTTLTYVLSQDVGEATMAHIHRAQGGVNGPVVQRLDNLDGTEGTVTLTADDVADLEAGRLYVNVHSPTHPGGEIRGQIMKPGEQLFIGVMTGAQEAPPVDSTETGAFAGILDEAMSNLRFELTTSFTPTAAHIHGAIAGVSGGVVHPLQPTGEQISGTLAVSADDVQALLAGEWYANAHTAANPAGEVRGQITRPGESIFTARLTGAQETPPVTSAETASGMLLLSYAEDSARFVVNTTAVPSAAHVHAAPAAVAGGVVFSLGTVGQKMSGTHAMTPEELTALRRGLWYFNVHTAANPAGELRGQILGVGERLYSAILSGAQEVPPVTTPASGGIGFILSADQTMLRYDGALSMITPSAAHVHTATVGRNGPVRFPLSYTMDGFTGEQVVNASDVVALEAGGLYANVHTSTNAAGEIRGQIARQ